MQPEVIVYRKQTHTPTAISSSVLTTLYAIRDLWSVRCHAGHRTYRQHRKGKATKRNESRFCETTIILLPSSIATKDRCQNSPPINRPMASWCYPFCRAFRKGLVESWGSSKSKSSSNHWELWRVCSLDRKPPKRLTDHNMAQCTKSVAPAEVLYATVKLNDH